MNPAVSLLLDSPLGVHDMAIFGREAERVGYDRLWIAETDGPDAFVAAAAVASATTQIPIGTSIVSVYSRTPATLAMAASSVANASKRPFTLGLGTGGKAIVEKWHGLSFRRPVAAVEECVRVLRPMFAGEKSHFYGHIFESAGFRLRSEYHNRMSIYVAALGPKMLEVAARMGDGVLLTLVPLDMLPKVVKKIRGTSRDASVSGPVRIVCRVPVFVGASDETLHLAAQHLSFYFTSPPYSRYFEAMGFSAEARDFDAAFARRDREASVRAISSKMIDALTVRGSANECRERLRAYLGSGVDDLMVSPVLPVTGASPALVGSIKP